MSLLSSGHRLNFSARLAWLGCQADRHGVFASRTSRSASAMPMGRQTTAACSRARLYRYGSEMDRYQRASYR